VLGICCIKEHRGEVGRVRRSNWGKSKNGMLRSDVSLPIPQHHAQSETGCYFFAPLALSILQVLAKNRL